MAGPYKGTEFVVKSYWGSYDMSSKLLGSYERHIQEKIVEIKNKNNLEIIINIGKVRNHERLKFLHKTMVPFLGHEKKNDELSSINSFR